MSSLLENEFNYDSLTKTQKSEFDGLWDWFWRYGYIVMSYPIVGKEEGWLKGLTDALDLIEAQIKGIQKAYKYRSFSKNVRTVLHRQLPEPAFGVHLQDKAA